MSKHSYVLFLLYHLLFKELYIIVYLLIVNELFIVITLITVLPFRVESNQEPIKILTFRSKNLLFLLVIISNQWRITESNR